MATTAPLTQQWSRRLQKSQTSSLSHWTVEEWLVASPTLLPPFRGHHWGSAFTYKLAVSLLFAIVFSSSICIPEANLAHYKKYLGAVPPSRITCFLTFAARHLPHSFIHKMSSWYIDEAIAYNEDKLFAHGWVYKHGLNCYNQEHFSHTAGEQ